MRLSLVTWVSGLGLCGLAVGTAVWWYESTQPPFARGNRLVEAAGAGEASTVRRLLARGVDPDVRYVETNFFESRGGATPLLWASSAGHADVVALLLEAGADPNLSRGGVTPLWRAVAHGHDDVAAQLLAHGADGDPRQIRLSNDLIRAASKGFVMGPGEGYPRYPGVPAYAESAPSIEDVLALGADVNSSDPRGYTALMFAANLGLVNNVNTLLAHGADVTLRNSDNETALAMASADSAVNVAERAQIVEILRAHGAQE